MIASTMVYRWRGNEFAAHDPQLVGDALGAIASENAGKLLAPDVVAAARRPESPLHPLFEWNDRKAAKAHRLGQANALVRAVVVVIPDADGPAAAFVRLGADADGYTPIEKARMAAIQIGADRDGAPMRSVSVALRRERAAKVASACREMQAWTREYGDIAELRPVFDAIKEQLAALELIS